MTDNDLVLVRNRNNGSTGYVLPDSNTRRSFAPGETKKIPLGELRALQYAPGGSYMLDNLLIIESEEALNALNMKVEPEYFYTEKQIRELLVGVNNMDSFLDFLDFATEGAIEIAKEIAVKEQIPDTRKRKALSEKTGFNIDNAIMVNEVMKDDTETEAPEEKKERRVSVKKETVETPVPTRRTSTPETKVDTTESKGVEAGIVPTTPKYVIKK